MFKKIFVFCLLLCGALLCGTGNLLAQEIGAKNTAFNDLVARYRPILAELTAFKQEYPNASPQRQQQISDEYQPKFTEAESLRKQLLPFAEAAWEETPGQNPQAAAMIYSFIEFETKRDNYEVAYRLFKKALAAPLSEDKQILYIFAARAAMNCMEFDDAQNWIEQARKSGILEKYVALQKDPQVKAFVDLAANIPQLRRNWDAEKEIRRREAEAAQDPNQQLPRVEIETTKGKFVVELYENEAPNATANFISLVEKGFYDGTIFHRVLPHFMAQGGDPTGTGTSGPGYCIPCECRQPNYRKHFRGVLSMAHAGQDTGGSQFFLTFVPTSFLDGRHTAFGRVIDGMPVLAELQRLDPQDEKNYDPSTADKILRARVISKRDHDYTPKTLPSRR